jgi:NDP-sugar pyrophosphorylase family protein
MSQPRALVLTAGLGTRLRPLTYVRAKAAVPVNGETLARRVIRWLVTAGVTDLVLNLHHRPATIAASVGDGSDLGARVRYSWEYPVLGSAGGPRHALPLLVDRTPPDPGSRIPDPGSRMPPTAQTFIIVNGDTLTDVDVLALVAQHRASGAWVTLALIPNPRPDKYGGVLVGDDGRITGFTRAGASVETCHFIGVQVADAHAFARLEDGVHAESVNALYPRLMVEHPGSVRGVVCGASFHDIGTPADYLRTSAELAVAEGDRMAAARNTHVARSARIVRTAVWDDVVIGARAELIECIVADGARIPGGARYERCAIVPAGSRRAAAGERIEGDLLITAIDTEGHAGQTTA